MTVELGFWRVDSGKPSRVTFSPMKAEKDLEDLLVGDIGLLGLDVLLAGRQVPTAYGKFIDLLAIDAEGHLYVIELKRDRTPRDVVAQTLDYGSWVRTLGHDDVV